MDNLRQRIASDDPDVRAWLETLAAPTQPTGLTRDTYLDLAETIARAAIPWQRGDGLIMDQTVGDEPATTTARFVGALGLLIGAGRCDDLVEHCALSMDLCCAGYETGVFKGQPIYGAEFFTKELMYAYVALRGKVAAGRHRRWQTILAGYDPLKLYPSIRDGATHNFPIYAVTGELLRGAEGLGDCQELIDDALESQRANFTDIGMYRDPNDPITYDLTVRHQLGLMLSYGYEGRHRDWMDRATARGGLATLLFQSVTGQSPFGGRSNQFHIQEGMIAGICELEARRWTQEGNVAVAGALKRAARRAAGVCRPWISDMEPFRQTKSGFAPELRHGIDSGGEYSCYGLLAASLFATAWHLADETIEERLTPAEAGGYVLTLWPEFHKVFASAGGTHVEIDLKADLEKDATGLGRIHRADAPPELALSMPISPQPGYSLCTPVPGRALALGPAWREADGAEASLAQFSTEIEDVAVTVLRADPEHTEFDIEYTGRMGSVRRITERYRLSAEGLAYSVSPEPMPGRVWLTVPLLVTDGLVHSRIARAEHAFLVSYRGWTYSVSAPEGRCALDWRPAVANRNGLYRTGIIEDTLAAHLRIDAERGGDTGWVEKA